MREVAAEFERPVLLFSGGKDSIVLVRLAEKAFRPARFPFPLMHVDTGHNFPEESLEVPSIYYAHERQVFRRDGMLYALSPFITLIDGEEPFATSVRYRTVGDMSCTGAVESTAITLDDVVAEIAATRITERG